jgi:hypothetical protein
VRLVCQVGVFDKQGFLQSVLNKTGLIEQGLKECSPESICLPKEVFIPQNQCCHHSSMQRGGEGWGQRTALDGSMNCI